MRKSYPGQVVTNRALSTVLLFPSVEMASFFYRFVTVKYRGIAYAVQSDNEVLFETEDRALFAACTAKMDKMGAERT